MKSPETLASGQNTRAGTLTTRKTPKYLGVGCSWLETRVSPKNFLRGNIFNPDAPPGSLASLFGEGKNHEMEKNNLTSPRKGGSLSQLNGETGCHLLYDMVPTGTGKKLACRETNRRHFYLQENFLNFPVRYSLTSSLLFSLPGEMSMRR